MAAPRELARVLDEALLSRVAERALGAGWAALGSAARPAAAGLTGFLGDHFRVTLHARHTASGARRDLQLFVKCMPLLNREKAEFIKECNFYRREMLMFQLFEELGGDTGPNRWRPKAYFCDERVLVMPDLSVEGFAPRHFLETLELPDVLLTAASTARFHAAFADYCTRRTRAQRRPYDFMAEHGDCMKEPTFCESPWLRAAAKLSANFVNEFSTRYKNSIPNLELKLIDLFVEACDSLREYKDTLNVVVHKDLWMNNILFAPGQAVIVDYQCVRHGPPAFDLLTFLYLTTTREFREAHEREVFLHYYSVFSQSVEPDTTLRLKELGYDETDFFRWCERSRMCGLLYAIVIFPYALMEPLAAQRIFDDPATFEKYCNEDRTLPVLQYAHGCHQYRNRQLHAIEEFVDRYLLKTL